MSPRLVLYMAPASPPSRAVMMLAEMLGLQLDCKLVNLMKLEHRTPEFRKLNPCAKVPVLQDGDLILPESHAILKYLVTQYGGQQAESLYPKEARSRAIVDQRLFFNATVLFNKMGDIAVPTFLGQLKGLPQKDIDEFERAFSILDQYLQSSLYVAADRITIADISLGATATAVQVMHRIDAKRYPRSAEWLARMEKEPVFQKINAPGVELLSKLLSKFWDKNKTA